MKILEFPLVPLTDIPRRLRLLAEQIEDGEHGEVSNVVCVVEGDDTISTLGFGAADDTIRAVGLLHTAAAFLIHGAVE